MAVTEIGAGLRESAGRARIDAVRGAMRDAGTELLLAFGSGRHHFIGTNVCWWLSGVRQLGRDAVVVIPLDGEPCLIVTPAWDRARAQRESWVDDVAAVDDLAGELGGVLRARGWSQRTPAVAGAEDCSVTLHAAIAEAVPDAPNLLAEILRIGGAQDEYALACVQRAVEIAEAGYARLLEIARPGVAEFELAAEVDVEMRALGADDNFLLISASQHNRAVHAPTDRELARGDVILGEISPSVEGQFAQICRSAVIGSADERQRECFALLGEAFTAGLGACRPGLTVPELAGVINTLIAERGYGKYTKPPYMRSRGHSMGLGPLVPADISDRSDVTLAPGMTFVLHPNQYLPEAGYFLCGDQVVVTEDGARALSTPQMTIEEVPVG